MAIIEPAEAGRRVRRHKAEVASPRQRAMLETVGEHLDAEAAVSLDRLMATLAPEPAYHLWANGNDYGPKSRDGVVAYYTR